MPQRSRLVNGVAVSLLRATEPAIRVASPGFKLVQDGHQRLARGREAVGHLPRKHRRCAAFEQSPALEPLQALGQHLRRNPWQNRCQLAVSPGAALQVPENEGVPAMPEEGQPILHRAFSVMSWAGQVPSRLHSRFPRRHPAAIPLSSQILSSHRPCRPGKAVVTVWWLQIASLTIVS